MNWLFKEEPSHYSFDALVKDKRAVWSGVRNPIAQKHLHAVKRGDSIFYYHTGNEKSVVGIALALAWQPGRAQDFDPAGRRHKPGTPTAPPAKGPKAPRNPGPGTPPGRPGGAETTESKSGPGSAVLIARYTAIVLAQPTSPFPDLRRIDRL